MYRSHNLSLDANGIAIKEIYSMAMVYLLSAIVLCNKECPPLMTTAVGLITLERIIKTLCISLNQMEKMSKKVLKHMEQHIASSQHISFPPKTISD